MVTSPTRGRSRASYGRSAQGESPSRCRGRGRTGRTVPSRSEEIWCPKLFGCQKMSILYDIFSAFNSFKIRLMAEISFHGLSEMPKISLNRQFSLWTLVQTKADGDPFEFEYSDGTRAPLYAQHVNEILGLRAEGTHISIAEDNVTEETVNEVRQLLGVEDLTIANVRMIVERDIDEESPKELQHAFQISVIILSFALMLDCRDRVPRMPKYLFPYLTNAETLKELNYARCVLDCLGVAARKVHEVKNEGYSTCTVGGCSIVSQIFYLDSIDFGQHKMQASVFPRVKYYTKAKLDFLINMDKNTHSVNVCHWYGYYKRNDLAKTGLPATTNSRIYDKKKYKTTRHPTKVMHCNKLMEVIEAHHDGDMVLIEDLKKKLQSRKNALVQRVTEFLENEASSEESEERTTSDVHGMEDVQGQNQSFDEDATSERPKQVGGKTCEVGPSSNNDGNVREGSNLSQVGDKRCREVPRNSGSASIGPDETETSKRAKTNVDQSEVPSNEEEAQPAGRCEVSDQEGHRQMGDHGAHEMHDMGADAIEEARNEDNTETSNAKAFDPDVIMEDAMEDIEAAGQGTIAGEEAVSASVSAAENEVLRQVNMEQAVDAGLSFRANEVPERIEVMDEKLPGGAPSVDAGSGSANSADVNDLINTFFSTPPGVETLSGELGGMDNQGEAEAPIFDNTPQCARKDSMNSADNNKGKNNTEAAANIELSDSSVEILGVRVYRRRKYSKKMYMSKALKKQAEMEEPARSEGASTI